MESNSFTIKVNNQEYKVTPDYTTSNPVYKIETGCDYMFALQHTNGEWQIQEEDIKPFDASLIYNIGDAIVNAV